jgi:hypothetical protein
VIRRVFQPSFGYEHVVCNNSLFFSPDTKGPTLFFDQPVPKKSGRTVRFSWRSNEYAKFKCTFDDRSNFTDCGEGTEARLSTDNLKRNGEHILYVKGIDRHGNVGETIATKWIVGMSFENEFSFWLTLLTVI